MLIQVLLAIVAIVILGGVFYVFTYSGYQYWLWVNNQENQKDSENQQDRLIYEQEEIID